MNYSIDAWRAVAQFGFAIPLIAAALSAGLIVLLLPLLARHALAQPGERSSHRVATPQGGGIAVTAAAIAAALVVPALVGGFGLMTAALPALAAAAALAVVGAVDDFHTLAVAPRLALQTLAVAAVIATLPAELRVVPVLPWWVERAALLVAGLWFVNLVNFMDGLDWMTVSEAVPVTAGLVFIGTLGALPAYATVVALALGGAMVGFAPFNRPVARLFLGDVGSLPIGLLLFWMLVLLAGEGHAAAALLLPLYYLADATVTLLRRLANGEKVWQAHRSHFYQRATDHGWSVLEIVRYVFLVNLVLVILAAATVLTPSPLADTAALIAGCGLVAWLLRSFVRSRS